MEKNETNPGPGSYAAVFITVAIWSSTYISTKILILTFSPLQISLVRFTIGVIVLMILSPPRRKPWNPLDELKFFLAGFLSIFLYFLLENMAAKYTYASNISIIIASIPLLTSLIAPFLIKEEKFQPHLIAAFLFSMGGITILLSSGSDSEGMSFRGDLLALGAALVFALYSILLRTIPSSYPNLFVTRKAITYGWGLILLFTLLRGELPSPAEVINPAYLPHFLFLGLLASGLCFYLWGKGVRELGAVRSSQFIYLGPFITVSLSIPILGEPFTPGKAIGFLLIISGVLWAERGPVLLSRLRRTPAELSDPE